MEAVNGTIPWAFSIVYGANQGTDKRHLFEELLNVKQLIAELPWIIAGDFNVIWFQNEKWGFHELSGYDREFVQCTKRLEIDDLAYTGYFYTWTNKQSGADFVPKIWTW